MARVLVLAKSGFGKTFSLGHVEELGHIGLSPRTTYIISITSKELPFPGGKKNYKVAPTGKPFEGNRYITNDPEYISTLLTQLLSSPYENIVLDDLNYVMQDYYMANALKTGWDCPKKIGYFMGKIFDAIEKYGSSNKNVIILAHGEEVVESDGRIYFKMKTTGKMTDEYCTPEGKYDVVLVGRSRFDDIEKKVVREFITREDEKYSSPKSLYGMFEDLYIPNDLGIVVQKIKEFNER